MKKIGRYFWGVLLIAIGVLMALKIAGVITVGIFSIIAPVAVAFLGASIVANNRKNITGYLLILLAAVIFVRYTLDIDFEFKYVWAALPVIIGIAVLFFSYNTKKLTSGENHFVIFGGKTDKITDSDFKGCSTFCMFGGHEIDLRGIEFTGDIEINVTVLFGGVTVFVPSNVNVYVDSMPVFGGVENKTNNARSDPYGVKVKALAIFGGVEIKN
jgi:predicted membrane protein